MINSTWKIALVSTAVLLSACSSPDEKVNEYVESAKEFLAEDNYEAAHIQFSNALQINPNHVDALYQVTKIFEHEQSWPKVYRYLEKVLELQPDHVEALLSISRLELAANQLDKALRRSEKILTLAPDSVEGHSFRALLLFKLGDFEGAVVEAKGVLIQEPENLEAIMVLASERIEAQDPEGALVYLTRIDSVDNMLIQSMKVRAFNDQKNLSGAAGVFEQLIKLDPEKDEYYFALANQYAAFEKYSEALSVIDRLVKVEPDNDSAKLIKVQFINRHLGSDQALLQLQAFLKQQPKNIALNFYLADLYLRMDQPENAKTIFLKISKFDAAGEDGLRALNRLARMSYQAGDNERGSIYLQQVLSADSDNQEAIVLDAQRMMAEGDTEQAISVLRSVLKDNPRSAAVLALLGRAHQSDGRTELAIDQYTKALKSEPNNQAVLLAYCQLLVSQKKYSQANQLLSSKMQLVGQDVSLLRLMAQIKLTLKDWESAQQIADRLDELNGDGSVSSQIRGAIHLGQEEHEKSLNAFEKAYSQAEDKTRPMITLVRSYMALNKQQEALNFLDSVLKVDTDNLTALLLKIQILQVKGDLVDAESIGRQLVKLHSDKPQGYQQLAGLLYRQNRTEEAFAVLDSGITALPDVLSLQFFKASLLEQKNDLAKAITVYEGILKQDPDADIAANNLAVIYSDYDEFKDIERAKVLAQRFRQSEVPYFQDTLGWVSYKAGKLNDALYFHENAVKAMPDAAEFRYHLGMSYKAVGDSLRARAELEKALKLAGKDDAVWKQTAELALNDL
ncbi:tetratricopeptide repeat protein [Bacterioplanoides sp.]|uniref:tetratricopeptide repeat protein n=1 Tax=Bacterioplanoides sp. TaxID=2066072 RepID=UPI003AFFAE83